MQIGRSPPLRKPIPLTPLVDIVFLLLMFFMLSSTFTKFGSVATNPAAAGNAGTAAEKPAFPGAIVLVAGEGRLRVNGLAADLPQLPALLNAFSAKGVTRVALRAGDHATVQDLISALEAARTSAIADITVVR